MVKVEREDFEESFVTKLIFTDGNKGQEIQYTHGRQMQ